MPNQFIRMQFNYKGKDFFIDVAATGVTEYCNIRLNLVISTPNGLQKAIVKARTDFDLATLGESETLEIYEVIQQIIKPALPRAFFIIGIDYLEKSNA